MCLSFCCFALLREHKNFKMHINVSPRHDKYSHSIKQYSLFHFVILIISTIPLGMNYWWHRNSTRKDDKNTCVSQHRVMWLNTTKYTNNKVILIVAVVVIVGFSLYVTNIDCICATDSNASRLNADKVKLKG